MPPSASILQLSKGHSIPSLLDVQLCYLHDPYTGAFRNPKLSGSPPNLKPPSMQFASTHHAAIGCPEFDHDNFGQHLHDFGLQNFFAPKLRPHLACIGLHLAKIMKRLAQILLEFGLQLRHPEAHGNVQPGGAKDHETFGPEIMKRFNPKLYLSFPCN